MYNKEAGQRFLQVKVDKLFPRSTTPLREQFKQTIKEWEGLSDKWEGSPDEWEGSPAKII